MVTTLGLVLAILNYLDNKPKLVLDVVAHPFEFRTAPNEPWSAKAAERTLRGGIDILLGQAALPYLEKHQLTAAVRKIRQEKAALETTRGKIETRVKLDFTISNNGGQDTTITSGTLYYQEGCGNPTVTALNVPETVVDSGKRAKFSTYLLFSDLPDVVVDEIQLKVMRDVFAIIVPSEGMEPDKVLNFLMRGMTLAGREGGNNICLHDQVEFRVVLRAQTGESVTYTTFLQYPEIKKVMQEIENPVNLKDTK